MRPITLSIALMLLASPLAPAISAENPMSIEAELCRSQLDLLTRGGKLTESETARFTAQCDCLASNAQSGEPANSTGACAEDRQKP